MLTGKFEFRQTLLGNIKIYVEDKVSWGWNDPFDDRLYNRMRKATREEARKIINKIELNAIFNRFKR